MCKCVLVKRKKINHFSLLCALRHWKVNNTGGGGYIIKVIDIYGSKGLPVMTDHSERLLKLTCALKHSAESGCGELLF